MRAGRLGAFIPSRSYVSTVNVSQRPGQRYAPHRGAAGAGLQLAKARRAGLRRAGLGLAGRGGLGTMGWARWAGHDGRAGHDGQGTMGWARWAGHDGLGAAHLEVELDGELCNAIWVLRMLRSLLDHREELGRAKGLWQGAHTPSAALAKQWL